MSGPELGRAGLRGRRRAATGTGGNRSLGPALVGSLIGLPGGTLSLTLPSYPSPGFANASRDDDGRKDAQGKSAQRHIERAADLLRQIVSVDGVHGCARCRLE